MSKQKVAITPHRDAVLNLINNETEARIDRIEKEFRDGFAMVNRYNHTVTVFGSARVLEDNPIYTQARQLGSLLAQEGFTIITGGGGGIMEAACRGAYEAGGHTVGFNITLPMEQQLNPYLTESMPFRYFFARKVMLAYAASALVCFPGGYGTLDEMFEVITLIQTGKMPKVPVILVGIDFWQPLDSFIRDMLLDRHALISHGDEQLYTLTDDLEQVRSVIERYRENTSVFNTSYRFNDEEAVQAA
jgi:hypothetical protein